MELILYKVIKKLLICRLNLILRTFRAIDIHKFMTKKLHSFMNRETPLRVSANICSHLQGAPLYMKGHTQRWYIALQNFNFSFILFADAAFCLGLFPLE